MGRTRFMGPIRSSGGYEVGTGTNNIEVLDSDGKLKITNAVSADVLEDHAPAKQELLCTTSTGAYAVGKLVAIQKPSTVVGFEGEYAVVLATNATAGGRTYPAMFVMTQASTAANKGGKMAGAATVHNPTDTASAVGTPLYLAATGNVTATMSSAAGHMQAVGVVTVRSTGTGAANARMAVWPMYSKVVTISS